MCADVLRQPVLLGELSAALWAAERFLVRVDPHVDFEVKLEREGFVTDGAGERLLSRVNSRVS